MFWEKVVFENNFAGWKGYKVPEMNFRCLKINSGISSKISRIQLFKKQDIMRNCPVPVITLCDKKKVLFE